MTEISIELGLALVLFYFTTIVSGAAMLVGMIKDDDFANSITSKVLIIIYSIAAFLLAVIKVVF